MIDGGWAYVGAAYALALIVLSALAFSVWLDARRWASAEKELASKEGDQT
jgi:hypothetical protein